MSIVIRGLEMPKFCAVCPSIYYNDISDAYICRASGRKIPDISLKGCPTGQIVELPEKHGKLIDASKLKETLDYYIAEAGWGPGVNEVLGWVKEFIDAEPTIVEAEEAEGE